MPYVVYDKKNNIAREFDTAEKVSIYMLGRSMSEHYISKYDGDEPGRALNNPSIFIDELKQQLLDL